MLGELVRLALAKLNVCLLDFPSRLNSLLHDANQGSLVAEDLVFYAHVLLFSAVLLSLNLIVGCHLE